MKINKLLFAAIISTALFTACKNESTETATTATTTEATTAVPTTETPGQPAAEAVPTGPTTTIEYAESEYNFGKVKEGEVVKHVYKFKNTGSENLVISNAKGSCGCTVPNWPKEPIAPGGTGSIEVSFDSKGKTNLQEKRVTVTANTNPAQTFLTIKGEVTPDPNKKAETKTPSVPVTAN